MRLQSQLFGEELSRKRKELNSNDEPIIDGGKYDKDYTVKYEISNNLESEGIIQELEGLGNNVSDANTKREAIFKQLMPVFKKYFKGVKYELDGSVTNGIIEIFDTGSTGRGTNIANDSDFDFVLRVDREFKLNTPLFNSFISDV